MGSFCGSLPLSLPPGINFLRQATHLNSGIRSLPPSMSPTNHSPFPPSHFVSAEPHYTFLPNYSMTISVALSRISETERKHGIRGKGRSFYFRCSVDLTMPHMCLLSIKLLGSATPKKRGGMEGVWFLHRPERTDEQSVGRRKGA